ncbi:MAG: endonuclease/exonuclease/phosphatase family protein [Alphaproteobacteria bacterium]|nr:endonuclease/exonuclease/phosphatase family protein [Alphaproteobacteria bacterium]
MSNNYTGLRHFAKSDEKAAKRCAERLLKMREALGPIRARKSDRTLLVATWNIRDFDSNKFKFGPRLEESFYYIAEIISCFDLVAVQEVNRDLSALEKTMRILGREWDYIVTDATEGSGGNEERMAFVYNTEKVWFRKVAGEVVLPDGQLIISRKKLTKKEGKAVEAPDEAETEAAARAGFKEVRQQFSRTPFLVAFQSGWFKFSLCTVHIYFGDDRGEKLERRVKEIEALVKFFAKRQNRESKDEKKSGRLPENYILLGDFNVVSPEHETMQALKAEGFTVPKEIDGDQVRDEDDHFYDQIAVRVKDERFQVSDGGIVDMFAAVFRDDPEDLEIYKKFMPKKDPENGARAAKDVEAFYRKWRTWQMSDHAPLWVEIATDFTEHYLKQFVD